MEEESRRTMSSEMLLFSGLFKRRPPAHDHKGLPKGLIIKTCFVTHLRLASLAQNKRIDPERII